MSESRTNLDGLELDVAIIGAGVGGIYALHSMRNKLGLNAQSFEMASGVGGTWFWNRYPGCRVDTESTVYTYSFDLDMFQNWDWSERYAQQSEVESYLNAVCDKHDLKRSINFNTKIVSAVWNDETQRWNLTTAKGEKVVSRYLIEAVGLLSSSYAPKFPNEDKFKGQILVSSQWPEGVDLTGKKVAVVGTGSTGIQVITSIAPKVGELHVLQRSAQWVVPLGIGPFPADARERIKKDPIGYRNWALDSASVFGFEDAKQGVFDVSEEERNAVFEAAWQKGNGFSFMLSTFTDITVTPEANKATTDFIKAKIQAAVKDPKIAEMLTPTDYYARRPLAADGYYEVYNQPNVHLHNVKANPINGYTENGIIVGDQEIVVDYVIMATGFDAMTGNYLKIETVGANGQRLADLWADGPRGFGGLTIAGFPNLFTVFGPFSPFTSQPLVHEWQVDYFSDLIAAAEEKGGIIHTDVEAQDEWVKVCQEGLAGTLFQVTDSWINGANIPGKPRTSMWFMGGMHGYMKLMNQIRDDGYRGFTIA